MPALHRLGTLAASTCVLLLLSASGAPAMAVEVSGPVVDFERPGEPLGTLADGNARLYVVRAGSGLRRLERGQRLTARTTSEGRITRLNMRAGRATSVTFIAQVLRARSRLRVTSRLSLSLSSVDRVVQGTR